MARRDCPNCHRNAPCPTHRCNAASKKRLREDGLTRASCPDCAEVPCDRHRCTLFAIDGGRVCSRFHGGRAPQTAGKAEERAEAAKREGVVAKLLEQLDIDDDAPLPERLLEAVRITGRMMAVYRFLVDGLDLEPDVTVEVVGEGARTSVRYVAKNEALYGPDHLGDAKPHVLVNELHRWTEAHAKAVGLAIDKDAVAALVELEVSQARVLVNVMQTAVDGLMRALVEGGVAERRAIDGVMASKWPAIARAAITSVSDGG